MSTVTINRNRFFSNSKSYIWWSFFKITNNDLGVSTALGSAGIKIKYYPVFVWSGYRLNSNGVITVTLPALQSGFSYSKYMVYECRVDESAVTNILRVKTDISGNTMTCTYILTTTGDLASNGGNIYSGFMLIAYKKV